MSDEAEILRDGRRRTRRGFLTLLGATVAGYGGWRWLMSRERSGDVPWPIRRVLEFNEDLSLKILPPARLIDEVPDAQLPRAGPRLNGDVGLDSAIDIDGWRLRVIGTDLQLAVEDLRAALPEVSQNTPLNCVEGWTTSARWTGVRVADFLDRFAPGARQRKYVSMATPDRAYYVGLDMASALHPQTLLCFAINGRPLTVEHGAPLRLLMPVKYGFKNLKRIGSIECTDARPADYWADRGYDWFAGL